MILDDGGDLTGIVHKEHPDLLKDIKVTKLWLWRLCVPHLAQILFFQKNQMLQIGFFIYLLCRNGSVVKNYEIWTFKVNFLCQKTSKSFVIFFFIDEYHIRTTFFVKDIF